ncbi:hypothetical protein WHK35_14665, partial [Staphylococcus aureus]|uniref:hypothetical protein n=1 Tax=Staphylococcus aureus TaxID=1280 RepID=UPI0039BE5E97
LLAQGVVSIREVVQELPAPIPSDVRAYNEAASRNFFEALPETGNCPRCNCAKHKAEFGVRILKKSPQGVALKIARQSYCKDCR